MNIILHELRAGRKAFLFWSLGLAVLVIAGMTKFLGFSESSNGDIMALLNQFPKIFLAMFGMSSVDIRHLGGYYSVLENFVLICVGIFAIQLGINAVSRESIDKTYEFVFTKPRTRAAILSAKLTAGLIFLFVFCVLNLLFSYIALVMFGIENTIGGEILLYAAVSLLIGLLFYSLAALLAAALKRSEQGSKISNAVFIVTYILWVVYNSLDEAASVKPFAPLAFFEAKDIIAGRLDIVYIAVCVIAAAVFISLAFRAFNKRDLSAV